MKIRLRPDLLELVQNIHVYEIIHIIISPCTEMWKMIDRWHTTILTLHFLHIYDIRSPPQWKQLHPALIYATHRYCQAVSLSPFHCAIEMICLTMLGQWHSCVQISNVYQERTCEINTASESDIKGGSALKNARKLSNTIVKIFFAFTNIVLTCMC